MAMCNLLVSRGASVHIKSKIGITPLTTSVHSRNAELVIWLIKQHGQTDRLHWDNSFFCVLMQKIPEAAWIYLDQFAIEIGPGKGGMVDIRFSDLRHVYGSPDKAIDSTALATAVKFVNNKNVLAHRLIQHTMFVKWEQLRQEFLVEEFASNSLTCFHTTSLSSADRDWMKFKHHSDYAVIISRVLCWVCIFNRVRVELNRIRSGGYFKSYWNWLRMITYGAVLASIPLEFAGESACVARDRLFAFIAVALWINLLQYLVDICLISRLWSTHAAGCARDCCVYLVFMLAFGGGLHLILSEDTGYETFGGTLITILLMLFGKSRTTRSTLRPDGSGCSRMCYCLATSLVSRSSYSTSSLP